MELLVESAGADIGIVHVVGHVDGSNFQQLIQRGQQLYDGGVRKIVLELSRCEYMSSSGLVALNTIAKLLHGEKPPETEDGWRMLKTLDQERPGDGPAPLVLVNPTPRVDRVLDMAGMKLYLPVYSDTASALASWK
jgi:anti-anti-sigma regulatory factor